MTKKIIIILVFFLTLSFAFSSFGLAEAAGGVDTTEIDESTCDLLNLLEGELGGLLSVVAGIGALVAAAMGMYRLGWTFVVVAVGSFIAKSMVTIYFDLPENCQIEGSSGSGGDNAGGDAGGGDGGNAGNSTEIVGPRQPGTGGGSTAPNTTTPPTPDP